MTTFETDITPAQALRELKSQQNLLKYAIALLDYGDNIPEIRDCKTMLDNWNLQAEHYLDQLSPLLCLSLINPNTTLQTYPHTNQRGLVELPKPLECQLP